VVSGMADEDEGTTIALMAVGAAVIFIALFLPLLVVRFLLLIGIAIGAFAIWKKVAATAVALIVVLIILRFADHSVFVWLTDWLGF